MLRFRTWRRQPPSWTASAAAFFSTAGTFSRTFNKCSLSLSLTSSPTTQTYRKGQAPRGTPETSLVHPPPVLSSRRDRRGESSVAAAAATAPHIIEVKSPIHGTYNTNERAFPPTLTYISIHLFLRGYQHFRVSIIMLTYIHTHTRTCVSQGSLLRSRCTQEDKRHTFQNNNNRSIFTPGRVQMTVTQQTQTNSREMKHAYRRGRTHGR